jgi:arylsulfatase A-like enzyme
LQSRLILSFSAIMKPITSLLLGVSAFCAAMCGQASAATPLAKPNIVFILADDLGWSDTTLYGTTKLYETPNLERLAKRGMLFSRAYSASPLCSPTRASILSGQSPARVGITAPNCHLGKVQLQASTKETAPPNNPLLDCESATRFDTRHFTLAEALKQAGYATAHFGKWHLGPEPYSPLQHGFDIDLPHTPGPGPAGSYVAPWKFPDFDPATPDEHIEDRMAKEAVAFMEKNKDRPFFLNYWQFSVHAPFDAKKELIEKYRSRVKPGDPQRSPTYAAMVESMDDAVGTLLDAIDRLGIAERTIVVFFSDNRGNMYDKVDGTSPTSNAPLRGGKATVFEGGVRVPCIVDWPGVAKPGSRSETIIQSSDFYPTFIDLLGLKPEAGQVFDGISIAPALRGGTLAREAVFTYFPHSPARVPDHTAPAVTVTTGDWKLIRLFHQAADGSHTWQLYNLKEDPGERNDLAVKEPERVKRLDAQIEKFLTDTGAVLPKRNPAYRPGAKQPGPKRPGGKRPGAKRPAGTAR